MEQTPASAKLIAQDLLARTGRGLMTGDFELFAPCFSFPQEMDTLEGRRVIASRDEAQNVFENVRRFFEAEGVTVLDRQCVEASYQDENTISATHKSRLLKGVTLIQEPYPAYSIVKRIGGDWKIAFTQYAIQDAPAHNKALMDQ